MSRVRVFIATTEGPVAVQRITAEDPDVPSVACRDGTTEVLAISRDYTRFVERGTGLVAALTGHGAYRLDLDRPVDGGRSWQLPVLLAHLLEAEGRLAGPDEPADLALLATGEVDRDQRVRRVGRIPEKLAAAGDLLARHRERGPPIVLLVPAADRTPAVEGAAEVAPGGVVRVLAWERVMGLAALEEPSSDRRRPPTRPGPDRGARRGGWEAGETRHAEEGPGTSAAPVSPSDTGRAGREDAREGPDDAGASARRPPAPVGEPDRAPPVRTTKGTTGGTPAGTNAGPTTPPTPPDREVAQPARRRAARAAAVILLAAAAAGVAAGATWWNGPRHWETLRRSGDYRGLESALQQAVVPFLAERFRKELRAAAPLAESLVFSLVEQRTADGRACAPRGFRDAEPAPLAGTPMPPLKPGFFRSEGGTSLCQAVYRVANEGSRLVYVYFAVRPSLSFAAGEAEAPALRRAAAIPPGASLALDLELGQGRFPSPILGADLLVLAAPSPSPQIRRAFELATGVGSGSEEPAGGGLEITALPALGLTVKGASHAILR